MDINVKRKFNKGDNVKFNPLCFSLNKKEGSSFKEGRTFKIIDVHYNYSENELMYEINWGGAYLYREELEKVNK